MCEEECYVLPGSTRVRGDSMTYLLDANVFIQAKNLHYGLDFCPVSGWGKSDKSDRLIVLQEFTEL